MKMKNGGKLTCSTAVRNLVAVININDGIMAILATVVKHHLHLSKHFLFV